MEFSELGLSELVLRAVGDAGYTKPTPIQEQAIPVVLMGRDVMGVAQTGTGKTASFTLPMIEILASGRAKARMPRSVILEPTRELAAQVASNFETYGKHHALNKALLIGGESMGDQIRVLDRGADVLIATPGRLLDLFERGHLLLSDVKILVIDEADRMLDMGFIPDVERIVSLMPRMRQTLFFSATMGPEIRRLADAFLINPREITVSSSATPAETVEQFLVKVPAPKDNRPGSVQKEKRAVLRTLIRDEEVRTALIFCNRKRDVGVLHRSLTRHGFGAVQLHGDLAQSERTETLAAFREGGVQLLVCSDVAARGLDITNVSHVFNFDVPAHAEDYVHRIGRTGRAGRQGRAFTLVSEEDRRYLASIIRLIGREIPRYGEGASVAAVASVETVEAPQIQAQDEPKRPRGRGRRDRRDRGAERRSPAERQPTVEVQPDLAAPEVAVEAEAAPQRPRRREEPHEKAVVGLGDHVPAFLLREPFPDKRR